MRVAIPEDKEKRLYYVNMYAEDYQARGLWTRKRPSQGSEASVPPSPPYPNNPISAFLANSSNS